MSKSSKIIERGSGWLQDCFLYCVMLPRDRGDGAIGTDLARSRFGNCCGLLPNCLHVYLLLLSLTLLGHSLCGGAGPPRLLDVLWCVCVRIEATCPRGHRMSGSAHPLQPPHRCNPHTSVAGRGCLGLSVFQDSWILQEIRALANSAR